MDQTRDDAFGLYQRCISSGVVEYLQKRAQVKVRRSIYTAQVVIWLMILRRLQPKGTLANSVEWLLAGGAGGRSAEAGAGEGQAEHLHSAGRDLADDPAAAATEGDAGNQCGVAAGGRGRWLAERLSACSAEADFAPDRRVQSRTATAAEAIMLASDDRTGGAAARDLEPGRRVPILSPGRFVTGTGSQPIAAESIPTSRKPAWTRSLAGTAHPGAA